LRKESNCSSVLPLDPEAMRLSSTSIDSGENTKLELLDSVKRICLERLNATSVWFLIDSRRSIGFGCVTCVCGIERCRVKKNTVLVICLSSVQRRMARYFLIKKLLNASFSKSSKLQIRGRWWILLYIRATTRVFIERRRFLITHISIVIELDLLGKSMIPAC